MKQNFPESLQETQAKRLWKGFQQKDKESFWLDYEQLIAKSTTLTPPQNLPKSMANKHAKTPKPKREKKDRFQKSTVLYCFKIIFMMFCLKAVYALVISISQAKGEIAVNLLVMIVLVACIMLLLWQWRAFYISASGLWISHNLLIIKKYYAWQAIQSITIWEHKDGRNEYKTYIAIWLKDGSRLKMNYNLPQTVSQAFIQGLQSKRVQLDTNLIKS